MGTQINRVAAGGVVQESPPAASYRRFAVRRGRRGRDVQRCPWCRSAGLSPIDGLYAIDGAGVDRVSISWRETRSGGGCVANVEAHITGTVWKIEVSVGDQVQEGDSV